MSVKKIWKYISLISKGIFHYVDLISDLMIIKLYYFNEESLRVNFSEFNINFFFLMFMLLLERYHTFKYF